MTGAYLGEIKSEMIASGGGLEKEEEEGDHQGQGRQGRGGGRGVGGNGRGEGEGRRRVGGKTWGGRGERGGLMLAMGGEAGERGREVVEAKGGEAGELMSVLVGYGGNINLGLV